MKKLITIVFVSVLLTASVITAPHGYVSAAHPFTDVKSGSWYEEYVEFVYSEGLMNGTSENQFSPAENMTRAQLVTVLARLANADLSSDLTESSFSDVPSSAWYADAVNWAANEGLVLGYDGNVFKPNSPILRREIAVLFARYLDFCGKTLPDNPSIAEFADKEEIPSWAFSAAERLRMGGILSGNEKGEFLPGDCATRAEIASILVKLLSHVKDEMHQKLANIKSLCESDGRGVILDYSVIDRITDYGFQNSISAKLLPQMGLDTDMYRIVADSQNLERFRNSTHSEGTKETEEYLSALRIQIENTVTGEKTDTKNVLFFVRRHKYEGYSNPGFFDASIDLATFEQMKTKSVESSGNSARLEAAFDKMARGEDCTVAFIGGSITEGSNQNTEFSYTKMTYNWIASRFPQAKIKYVNAGISGTPSDYGVARLKPMVLNFEPDILFVEFAVNDAGRHLKDSYEALIREVLLHNNNTAVVALYAYCADETMKADYNTVADYYSLPVIDIEEAVRYGIHRRKFSESEFALDGVHPGGWGFGLMAKLIVHNLELALDKIESDGYAEEIPEIPELPLTSDLYLGLKYLDVENFPNAGGNWEHRTYEVYSEIHYRFPNSWSWHEDASPFSATLQCSTLFVILENDYAYDIFLDGKLFTSVKGEHFVKLILGKETASHTVEIHPAAGYSKAEIYAVIYK